MKNLNIGDEIQYRFINKNIYKTSILYKKCTYLGKMKLMHWSKGPQMAWVKFPKRKTLSKVPLNKLSKIK